MKKKAHPKVSDELLFLFEFDLTLVFGFADILDVMIDVNCRKNSQQGGEYHSVRAGRIDGAKGQAGQENEDINQQFTDQFL